MANRVVFLIDRRLQDPLERAGDLCSLSGDRGTLAEVLTGQPVRVCGDSPGELHHCSKGQWEARR
jgi:hypothetical protein